MLCKSIHVSCVVSLCRSVQADYTVVSSWGSTLLQYLVSELDAMYLLSKTLYRGTEAHGYSHGLQSPLRTRNHLPGTKHRRGPRDGSLLAGPGPESLVRVGRQSPQKQNNTRHLNGNYKWKCNKVMVKLIQFSS